MKYLHLTFLLFNVVYVISINDSKSLRLVEVLFRHGDRTPTETYTNDPYRSWPEGWGSLTKVGKRQMFTLGELLRNTYKDYLAEYYKNDGLVVRSSYAHRCIMSAQCLLAGLYPPVKEQIWNPSLLWQPIPVTYVPRNEDNVIVMKKPCPVYETQLKAAYESQRIKDIDIQNKELYEYLTFATGDEVNDINEVEFLYNTLEIEMINNLTLPNWTKNVSFDALREIAKLNLAIFTDNKIMKRLSSGNFLKTVLSYMTQKIEQTSKEELILFSGHDITIVSVLRTLGFDHLLKPDYGAYLIFELHEVDPQDYEIRFFYGQNFESSPKHIDLKHCPAPCKLKEFVVGYEDIIPVDWATECLLDTF
ncbi:hypothetical protein FQA39_LY07215 [Lamprigera yunnana]|nr:hypothetical protein FQA39_LY07215 [Lamprigera yunnana]